ncbi:MAG TPA: hypothetical protein P5232_00180 [Candidatus Moranbacteria bacterium]|nr:hypothetical protein [Candidatus Moranbacteria bacterium]
MFLKLQPLIYSIFFFIGLELIVFFHRHVIFIVFFLLFMALFQGWKIGHRWKFSVLPIFFVISSVALLYLVTIFYEQQAFIILASAMYYLSLLGAYRLSLYEGDQTARGMNMAASVSTIFFTYASAYGLYLNFLVPLYYLMLVFLFATLFVSYQFFSIIYHDKKIVWAYSFLISLVMAEIIWTINFWPFGYLTSGVVALILYFVLWDIIQSYFLNILNKRRAIANIIFFSLVIGLVLATSKWIPVI